MKQIELINKRKLREKHFLREDGTIVANVYNSNVHYNKNGKYEEIDNTLIKENDGYTNRNNDYKVFYKDNGNDSLMKMIKDENYIDIKLKNSNETKICKNESSFDKVSYNNVLDGIDIKYQTLPTKVKETIVLQNRVYDKLTFEINTNLDLKLDNNSIVAFENGNPVFIIEKPYMEDAIGEVNNDISYDLRKENGNFELDLILDTDWLNSQDTVFPVYIDPTITNVNQAVNLYDTYIYPGDTGVNKGSQPILKAGVETVNGNYVTNRALIKFDLPEIGTGSEIIGAYLTLTGYPTYDAVYDNKLVTMHRITQDWSEDTANWEQMNNKYDERVESIYYGGRSYLEGATITPENGLYDGNITNLVKKWYRDTDNFGILLKSANETYSGEQYPAFCSKNYNDGTSAAYNPMPVFQLVYRNMNGLENYLDYLTQNFTDASTHVNTFTGNMTGVFSLGHTIGGKLPVSVSLVYNTNDVVLNNTSKFGRGYKLSLEQTLRVVTIDETEYLEYVDEDGTIHYFYREGQGTSIVYKDEDGLGLTVETENTSFVMTDKNGGRMLFTNIGNKYYLTTITDISGNSIRIVLDANNNVSKVIDANNAEINFVYSTNEIQVISPDSTTYLKYSNGILNSIQTVNGTTSISYNSNNIIESITDVSGLKINYEYYSKNPYRMKKITQYGLNNALGNYLTLSYGFNTTSIVDHKGKTQTLIFNQQGNLLSINSLNSNEDVGNAYAITRTYGDENRLLTDSIPTGYIKNYLKNSSFETDDSYFSASSGITQSFSSDCATSGNRSLKLVSESSNRTISQRIELSKGKYYTFSGNFKNNTEIEISLGYYLDNAISVISKKVIEASTDFKRESVTIYFEDSEENELATELFLEISVDAGTAYVDDIQLEEGEVANSYNIIENSDFSLGLSDWLLSTWPLDDSITTDSADVFEIVNINNNQNKALRVNMNPLQGSSFSKEFPIKGKKGDLYNISFWFKNEGIVADGNTVANNVMIYFKPVGSEAEYCILPSESLHSDDNIWQYFTFRYGADEDYEAIRLVFNQGRNANAFYITNLTFYKDLSNNYYEYDEDGNVTNIKESSKESSNVFGYDSNNQLISATTPKGNHLKVEYDNTKTDRVLSAISSTGIANQVKYDSFGNPILTRISKKGSDEITDGKYRIRSKGTEKYIKANYRSIVVEEDACSNTIWKLVKVEDKFRIIFDVLQNYNLAVSGNTLNLTPDNANNLFSFEKNDNGSYHIMFDTNKYLKLNNGVIEITALVNNNPAFEFYIEALDEEFIENSATYSEDGRFVTSVTDSNFNTTLYSTDSITGLITSQTDAKNQVINYTYNSRKQIASVVQGDKTVNYTYNDKNLLSKIKQDNREYNFTYDEFLNTKKVSVGDTITLVNNEYESNNGNLSSVTYGNGDTISYEYDEYNRLKTVCKMDNHYHYRYDKNGNIAKVASSYPIATYDTGEASPAPIYFSETLYKYDVGKRLIEYAKDDFKINYNYDSNDNVVSKQYKLEDNTYGVENTFDKDDMLTKTITDNQEVNYQYDGLGRLVNKNINNTYNIEYGYVSHGKRTSNLVQSVKNGNNKYSYQYDELNNITHIYYNDELQNQYFYDEYNELIQEFDYTTNQKIDYTYDNLGNMLTKVTRDIDTGSVIKTDSYEYANTNWKDQLTKYNNETIMYDEIGNPLTIGSSVTMNWINGRTLSSYRDNVNNRSFYYEYNQDGIRIGKEVNGVETKYFLENNNIIFEQRGTDIIYYLYDLTGIIGLKYNEIAYNYVKNLQGDIIGILDSNNNQVVTYKYDSWGKVLSIKDSQGNEITDTTNIGIINPFRYRSYYYDTETGLYCVSSRYYNPEFSRWINADNQIAGVGGEVLGNNMFAYCINNPINMSDPFGNWPKWATKLVAAAAVVVVVAAVAAVTVATAGTGTAIAAITVGAAKGAAVGFAVGAVTGAAGAAISHRISTGSWDGAGAAILNGMANGALSGAVSGAITGGITGGLSYNSGATSAGKGFDTFRQLKNEIGSPGVGNEWHHIVEQSQIAKSGFSPRMIQNTNNIMAISKTTHRAISGYYSSVQPFTNGVIVRNWLVGQSFSAQYEFGINVIKMFM